MNLLALLGGTTLYVQLSPERLRVRDARTGDTFDEPAVLAVTRAMPRKIVAVGEAALTFGGQADTERVHPFAHPRSLMGDYEAGEQLLKAAIRTLLRRHWLTPAPHIVLHPLGDPAGGLTQVEQRALTEMARAAGARQVTLWQGPPLTDEQLRTGDWPRTGKVLT